jgi:hypothetical protein
MLGVHALRMNSKRKLCKCENRTVAWRAHPSRYQGPTTHLAPRFRFSNQVRVRFHPPRRTRTRPRTLPPTPHVHPATYTACAPCHLHRMCTLPPTTPVHPAAYNACAPCRLQRLCTLPPTTPVHPAAYNACAPCRLLCMCTLPPTQPVHPATYLGA